MLNFLIHIVESSIVFTLLFLGYKFFLSQHTFYSLNRFVLLVIIPLSIIIPYLESAYTLQVLPANIPIFNEFHSENIGSHIHKTPSKGNQQINYILLFSIVYFIGVFVKLFNIISSIINLYKLKQKSHTIKFSKYHLIFSNTKDVFSYFNWIFIPEELAEKLDNTIIEHEKNHSDLKHSIDLIINEIYLSFFWFNPFNYLYRKSLKSIHEFQVDAKILSNNNIKTSEYLQLLLKNVNIYQNKNLYSYFGQPLIKKRIEMMCKHKTNQFLKLKYLILVPICALCMVSFTQKHIIINPKIITVKNLKDQIPSIYPIANKTEKDITSHYGHRIHPISKSETLHNGLDFKAKVGTPIIATANGIVVTASNEGNWGNLIVIKHTNGYETLYSHLNKINCKVNQIVRQGEIIGFSGETGRVKGPHLHYAVKHNGVYQNPIDYLN